MNKKISFLILLAPLILTGCVNKPTTLYQWGSYEDQIYAMYSDPGKVPVEEQIQNLERDYQQARAENKSVPPGYQAHLGYLYFQLGKTDQALQSFETEKILFPESTLYMDHLIARIKH
ncbi:MAG: DUF4810 domain-containing protein [Nitrosomonadales bacterium]|nr:DUF4810 domain-containing protein [Nitrosomonadales bacterium]